MSSELGVRSIIYVSLTRDPSEPGLSVNLILGRRPNEAVRFRYTIVIVSQSTSFSVVIFGQIANGPFSEYGPSKVLAFTPNCRLTPLFLS